MSADIVEQVAAEISEIPGDASRELAKMLYESGADIITDADRATAGLSPRGPYGLTREQLRIIEARHTEMMLHPLPPIIMPKVGP